MIELLELNNFQSHESSVITFSKNVNVIVGQSDIGKSTFFRALNWLVKNKPAGFSFRSNFSDVKKDITRVAVKFFDNDNIVIREKAKNLDRYVIFNNEKEDYHEFKALRGSIPEEVSDIVDFSNYNLQGQHDKYFLLQDSSSEVAKSLNEVVGLEDIDTVMYNMNSITTRTKKNLDSKKLEKDYLVNDLKQYENFDKIKIIVDRLKNLFDEIKLLKEERSELAAIFPRLKKLNEEISYLQSWLEIEKYVETLPLEISKIDNLLIEIRFLKDTVETLQSIDKEIDEYNQDIFFHGIAIEAIEEARKYKRDEELLAELEYGINTIDKLDGNISSIKVQIKKIDKEINKIGVCPVTGEYCEIIANRRLAS